MKKPEYLMRLVPLALIVSIGLLASMLSKVQAQVSIDAVLKACEKKTMAFESDEKGHAIMVGESIDGYCQGILEGMFAVLVRNDHQTRPAKFAALF